MTFWVTNFIPIKMHSIESRFVIEPSNMLFAGVYVSLQARIICALSTLEILKAGAVKGLSGAATGNGGKTDRRPGSRSH